MKSCVKLLKSRANNRPRVLFRASVQQGTVYADVRSELKKIFPVWGKTCCISVAAVTELLYPVPACFDEKAGMELELRSGL